MIGLGTGINVAGILVGGFLGLLMGKGLSQRFQEILTQAAGLCVLFLGIAGAMEHMLILKDGSLGSQGTMMVIGSFVAGALLGEWLNLEQHMEDFGIWLREKTKSQGDTRFIEGFLNTSFTVCIGAMAVVGSIQDGVFGDYSILTAKAVLDLIIVFVLTASLGRGCIFSAIPVALFQGSITFLSRFLEPFLTDLAMDNLSLTGSMLIFCVGVNLIWGKKIKVANLLPAILVAVAWAFLPW
ncbi:MAG: DUF554 domain-containing protein [Lachnospiraceae bacterium]|nr:DUF554 domain-containing protein [Lachnospiraceae bacterium]